MAVGVAGVGPWSGQGGWQGGVVVREGVPGCVAWHWAGRGGAQNGWFMCGWLGGVAPQQHSCPCGCALLPCAPVQIKNPKMKLVQELKRLPARVRLIISGTPIQVHTSCLFDLRCCSFFRRARVFMSLLLTLILPCYILPTPSPTSSLMPFHNHAIPQNNLTEMWALFDFCCEGLLGDSRTFKKCVWKRGLRETLRAGCATS